MRQVPSPAMGSHIQYPLKRDHQKNASYDSANNAKKRHSDKNDVDVTLAFSPCTKPMDSETTFIIQ